MPMTDLTGTTWTFGDALVSNYTTSFSYAINANCVLNWNSGDSLSAAITKLELSAKNENYRFPSNGLTGTTAFGNGGSYSGYYYGYKSVPKLTADYKSFIMTITGGADATNPTLIEWLLINGRMVTSPTSINYKNTVIASIESGQRATLICNGKIMASDVVIAFGDDGFITYNGTETRGSSGQVATLSCDGKLMVSDVAIRGKNYYLVDNGLGTTVVIVSHDEEDDHSGTTVII